MSSISFEKLDRECLKSVLGHLDRQHRQAVARVNALWRNCTAEMTDKRKREEEGNAPLKKSKKIDIKILLAFPTKMWREIFGYLKTDDLYNFFCSMKKNKECIEYFRTSTKIFGTIANQLFPHRVLRSGSANPLFLTDKLAELCQKNILYDKYYYLRYELTDEPDERVSEKDLAEEEIKSLLQEHPILQKFFDKNVHNDFKNLYTLQEKKTIFSMLSPPMSIILGCAISYLKKDYYFHHCIPDHSERIPSIADVILIWNAIKFFDGDDDYSDLLIDIINIILPLAEQYHELGLIDDLMEADVFFAKKHYSISLNAELIHFAGRIAKPGYKYGPWLDADFEPSDFTEAMYLKMKELIVDMEGRAQKQGIYFISTFHLLKARLLQVAQFNCKNSQNSPPVCNDLAIYREYDKYVSKHFEGVYGADELEGLGDRQNLTEEEAIVLARMMVGYLEKFQVEQESIFYSNLMNVLVQLRNFYSPSVIKCYFEKIMPIIEAAIEKNDIFSKLDDETRRRYYELHIEYLTGLDFLQLSPQEKL